MGKASGEAARARRRGAAQVGRGRGPRTARHRLLSAGSRDRIGRARVTPGVIRSTGRRSRCALGNKKGRLRPGGQEDFPAEPTFRRSPGRRPPGSGSQPNDPARAVARRPRHHPRRADHPPPDPRPTGRLWDQARPAVGLDGHLVPGQDVVGFHAPGGRAAGARPLADDQHFPAVFEIAPPRIGPGDVSDQRPARTPIGRDPERPERRSRPGWSQFEALGPLEMWNGVSTVQTVRPGLQCPRSAPIPRGNSLDPRSIHGLLGNSYRAFPGRVAG